ncbi:MAG TPA: hypothetical protein VEK57_07375 [Thermoanaerobaculia bacterium]|nr:hypothetical protein [Thermoanaerobaculia bacterium]
MKRQVLMLVAIVVLAPFTFAQGLQPRRVAAWTCVDNDEHDPALRAFGRTAHCEAWSPAGPGSGARPSDARPAIVVPSGLSSSWTSMPLPLVSWDVPIAELRTATLVAGADRILRPLRAETQGDVSRPCSAPGASTAVAALPLRVIDPSRGIVGPLRNRVGTYAGRGASATVSRIVENRAASYALECTNELRRGFCGMWIELGDFQAFADPSQALSVPDADHLVIRGRGTPAGKVGVSDLAAAKRDEPVFLGPLSSAVRDRGGWIWRHALPDGIDRRQLRSLVIDLTSEERARTEITGVWLVRSGDRTPKGTRVRTGRPPRLRQRGLWVWNTADLLSGAASVDELLSRARMWRLSEIYLQLPHDPGAPLQWRRESDAALAALIRRLKSQRLKVHALDGMASMALPGLRARVVELAQEVSRYNARCGRRCEFDALHLDIEPYLLAEFGGRRRAELLDSTIATLAAVRRAVEPLPLWIDIPFWYDEGEEQGRPGTPCERQAFLTRAWNSVDGVVVMSYRTSADGADGLAMHALGEATLAKSTARPFLFAVETVPLPPEDEWLVRFDEKATPKEGEPLALLVADAGDPFLLFSSSPAAADLDWIGTRAGALRILPVRFLAGPPPGKITFHGQTAAAVDSVVGESAALLSRSGGRVDGVAYHELRTLPPR